MTRETEVYFTAYIRKTNNPKLGRPSANLNYEIKVRVDDKLNNQLEEYAKNHNTLKAVVIREVLSSFLAQNLADGKLNNKENINMDVNSTSTLRFAITVMNKLTRAVVSGTPKECEEHNNRKAMLWENTFIKKQYDQRLEGKKFSIEDHVKAMVYAMLTSDTQWKSLEEYFNDKGEIFLIDELFHNYNPEYVMSCNPEELAKSIKGLVGVGRFTKIQMEALININIPKLLEIEEQYGSVDDFYNTFIKNDGTLKSLVRTLSDGKSENKLVRLDVSGVTEYLRNLGYDIGRPDSHTRKILGCNGLGLFDFEIVPETRAYEVIDAIAELAKIMGKSATEVDYILWLYCTEVGF